MSSSNPKSYDGSAVALLPLGSLKRDRSRGNQTKRGDLEKGSPIQVASITTRSTEQMMLYMVHDPIPAGVTRGCELLLYCYVENNGKTTT